MDGHSSFQNGEAFIKNGGQKGPQIEIIPPGNYRINPYLFKVTKSTATKINEGEIGLIESADGSAIPAGRIFAKVVPGHNSFQSGRGFPSKTAVRKGRRPRSCRPGSIVSIPNSSRSPRPRRW